MTPKQIVTELDRYIVGQFNAKKAVAIALRNRYRRSMLSAADREEITPKNIIMKGPTGVGKTEIARRLAKLVKAPFLKVEATKYTEVGYVGRDVESMIRDLVEVSIRLVKDERYKEVESRAFNNAVERVADALMKSGKDLPDGIQKSALKDEIAKHSLDQMSVEIQVVDNPKPVELQPGAGEINIGSIFGDMLPKKTKKRVVTVAEALKIYAAEESEKLIDLDSVETEALRRAENDGVIFIDEMDKIAGKSSQSGPDVSREGVQRDILPIVEGCTVSTKYGNIKTDYILFIASGAFHVSKVSDLIPELQGRFPVLVSWTASAWKTSSRSSPCLQTPSPTNTKSCLPWTTSTCSLPTTVSVPLPRLRTSKTTLWKTSAHADCKVSWNTLSRTSATKWTAKRRPVRRLSTAHMWKATLPPSRAI